MLFTPPISAATPRRRFRAWFGVQREFETTLGSGQPDKVTCFTNQLARVHNLRLTFRVLIHAGLPELRLTPEFQRMGKAVTGQVAPGFGEPYLLFTFRSASTRVRDRAAHTITLGRT